MNVVAITAEVFMRSDPDLDVQIAIGTAVFTAFAIAGKSDLLTGIDTGRDRDFHLFLDGIVAFTAAVRTDLLDAFAAALTVRTYALLLNDTKRRTGLSYDTAAASAGWTRFDIRSAGGTAAVTVCTDLVNSEADHLVYTMDCIEKIDLHRHIAVFALHWTVPSGGS